MYQGVPLGTPGYPNSPAKDAKFNYMTNARASREDQAIQLELLRKLHRRSTGSGGGDPRKEISRTCGAACR